MAIIGKKYISFAFGIFLTGSLAGAKNIEQVIATVKVGFLPVMKISWMVSPVTLVLSCKTWLTLQLFAQNYLPPQTWGEYL
jgi:hypothetical protein